MTKTFIAAAFALAALAAGCGSRHNDGDAADQQQDSAASGSVAGLVGFAQGQLARADADTSEPRSLAGINPPVSELDEPAAI